MTPSIVIALALLVGAAVAAAGRRDGRYELIAPHPYNNHYNDASAARDERAVTLRQRIA